MRQAKLIKSSWTTLSVKLLGHYQYYGVSENYRSIAKFYKRVLRMVHKWLNRRRQKRKMNWKKFQNYLTHYPLPKPKVVHNFYLSHDTMS